ncbi:MAG TPA: OsmC family protein [Pseudonocardia sp.]|nr:OsmC family protein [Pseudonocardia sp.]
MTVDHSVQRPLEAAERDDALRSLVGAAGEAIEDDIDRAVAPYQITGSGGPGVRAEVRIGRHRLLVDEGPALGGADAAPSPMEHALAGLLSAQVVSYRFWAAQLGIPLDSITVDVEGELDLRGFLGLDAAVRPGPGEVRVRVVLSGPASPEEYRRLRAAVDEHCPVLDLFRNATPVSTHVVTS